MEATINEVFYQDQSTRKELGETKAEAPVLDWQRFPMFPTMSAEVEYGKEPQDGGNYAALIGMFIDGVEAAYVTNWIPNDDDIRKRTYTLSIPKTPVKLMQRGKAHSVQFKLGYRRTVFGIPLPQWLSARTYDLAESEVMYYKIGTNPNLE